MNSSWLQTALLYQGSRVYVNPCSKECAIEDNGEHLVIVPPCECGNDCCLGAMVRRGIWDAWANGTPPEQIGRDGVRVVNLAVL